MAAVVLASAFALGACNSSDDDSGDGGMMPTTPGMPGTGAMQAEPSGDIFAIAELGDADEAARLDAATLITQLGGLLGVDGDAMEPIVFEDDEDVVTALRRKEAAGN